MHCLKDTGQSYVQSHNFLRTSVQLYSYPSTFSRGITTHVRLSIISFICESTSYCDTICKTQIKEKHFVIKATRDYNQNKHRTSIAMYVIYSSTSSKAGSCVLLRHIWWVIHSAFIADYMLESHDSVGDEPIAKVYAKRVYLTQVSAAPTLKSFM